MKYLLSSLFVLGLLVADAVALGPGDVAIIGIRSDDIDGIPSNGNDEGVAWLPLVDLAPGQMIFFSDDGWKAGAVFRGSEGAVKYTAPGGGLSAGTVMLLEYDRVAGGTPGTYTFTPDPAVGTYVASNDANVGTVGMLFATTGDNYFVFDGSTAAPNFIYGIKDDGAFDADSTSNDTTALPAALTVGTSAVSLSASSDDNYRYIGGTSGTQAELLALISNPANWESDSTAPIMFPSDGSDDITNGTGGTGGGGFNVDPPGGGGGSIVPEPSSVILWSLLGFFGITTGWRSLRRRGSVREDSHPRGALRRATV